MAGDLATVTFQAVSKNGEPIERRAFGATQPLMVGAFGVVSGIASSLLGAEDVGAVLTLSGLAMLLWGLHRLGRLGADRPRPG
jgi:hypothetical protein